MAVPVPIAFISYAREAETSEWVLKLGQTLVKNGIDVRLDEWHLRPGDDLGKFMEEAISESDFVLIICTPKYAAKANSNVGGVGYEGSIIKGAILTGATTQTKFIPLLRSGTPAEAVPRFLWNRLFLDFTEERSFDDSVEKLVRHMYGRPQSVRPELGPQPSFLQDPAVAELNSKPKKWILVAGTGNKDTLPEHLNDVSMNLGRELAEARFGLVTGGWPGVDRAVGQSFAKTLQDHGVPLDNYLVQVVEQSWDPPFKAGRIEPVPKGDPEYIESVRRADAAILIGGLGGTYRTGEYMRHAGKPVFPIYQTGGDAQRFFNRMWSQWYDGMIPGVPKDEFAKLKQRSYFPERNVMSLLKLWYENDAI